MTLNASSVMKKTLLSFCITIFAAITAHAQTLQVNDGATSWLYNAAALNGELAFSDGSVNVGGHTFTHPASGVWMTVSNTPIEADVVNIAYGSDGANSAPRVIAPAELAQFLTVSVTGQDVEITASEALDRELTYRLSGSGSSFTLHGAFKSIVEFNGVSLQASGVLPALWIDNGKRIDFIVADGTNNTFADAATNEKKSAFFVKGHAEWKGAGNVSISGNARHAYSSNEYTLFKNSFTGTFSIEKAMSDGLHIDQYCEVRGGNIVVKGTQGDCIDVAYALEDDGVTKTADEHNGQFLMSGGLVEVVVNADDTKGVKCEDSMTIAAGRINATANGDGSRGVSVGTDLHLGQTGAPATDAVIYLTATGGDFTDPATDDVNKCRGLKVKGIFYHYPSTLERNVNSTVKAKKIVDVDGEYKNLGGTLVNITIG